MNPNDPGESRLARRLEVLATILLIAVALLVGGVTVWDRMLTKPPQPDDQSSQPAVAAPPVEPIPIGGAPTLGDKRAKVVLILFSEFECPYCGRSARDVLPDIDRAYLRTGKVLLAWRHFPLPIHKNARGAAEFAACAEHQGKFWEFHDWAFRHQTELDQTHLQATAKALGLDLSMLRDCLESQAITEVQSDFEAGEGLSIAGTPTWLVGTMNADGKVKVIDRVDGAKPFAVLQKVIERAIASADPAGQPLW